MLLAETLKQLIGAQHENMLRQDSGLPREALQVLPELKSHALIVSGIRRCGKSTLLFQLIKQKYPQALYLNFEDPRLYDFQLADFSRLDQIIAEMGNPTLLFDEIQVIPQWEKYIRQKLEEGFHIAITGSNASLLSRELGTKLTGRHISKELFPFSYQEFCSFRSIKSNEDSLLEYLNQGGFPEFLHTGDENILTQLFSDILIRDIAVRFAIRDTRTLQKLAQYLVSNIGTPVSGNKLKILFEMGATSTVLEYLSHLESAWLFHFVSKFSDSLKKQLINPRKVYSIDTGLARVNSAAFTIDHGRRLENLVYLHLRRNHSEIYYFSEKGECDFVVFSKGKITEALQVCLTLTPDNQDREIKGLVEALKYFSLKIGKIITLHQHDLIKMEGFEIEVLPAHQYLY